MTRTVRIAVNMQPSTDAAGEPSWKAALPMGVLFEKSLDPQEIETARLELESKYQALVSALRDLRPKLQANVLHNWEFGDRVINFEHETSDSFLFVDRLGDALARDVNYSKRMIDLCKSFRRHVPDPNTIDRTIAFSAYHRSGFAPHRTSAAPTK